jgi:hypothetical protein
VAAWALLALGLTAVSCSAALSFTPITAPQAWNRAEFRIEGVPAGPNPFDPDVLAVDATITSPGGRAWRVPGFWYRNYQRTLATGQENLTATSTAEWRLRFTPREVGLHRAVVLGWQQLLAEPP